MSQKAPFETKSFGGDGLIRVLIVEDQEVLRIGLKYSLQYAKEIEIVGMANDGPTAVESAIKLKPSVILMDIGLPGFDGIEATKKIKEQIKSKIVVLTSRTDDKAIYAALEAGAEGYCLKDASTEKLCAAIASVHSGATWLDDEISKALLKNSKMADPNATAERLALSESELKVLAMLLEGASSTVIADAVNMQHSELQTYLRKLIQKVSFTKTSLEKGTSRAKNSSEFIVSKMCPVCNLRLGEESEICPYDKCALQVDHLIGSQFADRYEILSLLGAGTSGAVYKARHRYIQKYVAIKVLHTEHVADIGMLKRFRQEAAAASILSHPNILHVIDFGLSSEGQAFMIMDYIGGTSLDELIVRHAGLPAKPAIDIFLQICDGLGHAHDNNIIHRDVKPNNVLVYDTDDGVLRVKLVDFGTAKLVVPDNLRPGLTAPGQVFGSPTYMSPEQCMGLDLEPSSDIYSMGTLMYESLVGHPPFVTDSIVDAMYKQINEDCPPLSEAVRRSGKQIDVRLQAIVMKALRKDRYKRHQTMHELKDDLLKIA